MSLHSGAYLQESEDARLPAQYATLQILNAVSMKLYSKPDIEHSVDYSRTYT